MRSRVMLPRVVGLVVAAFALSACGPNAYTPDERFNAVYECKHAPEPGELYYECLHRLLPDMSDDEIDEVLDDGYSQT